MRTVVLGPVPPGLAQEIERRRSVGADLYDEVWEDEYHMVPAPSGDHARVDDELAAVLRDLARPAGLFGSGPFNLGEPDDYRVPDRALHRVSKLGLWVPTAALVAEIVSPDDESWQKLGFYAGHGVDEVVVADPTDRSLAWMSRLGASYERVSRSALLRVAVDEVAARIEWP